MVRSNEGSHTNEEDISMSGPRIAQYMAGNSQELSKVFVVSNVNEQWISDSGVRNYFMSTYSGGELTYPTHNGTLAIPICVSDIHADIHYSQIAHNENGITAADGMYAVLFSCLAILEALFESLSHPLESLSQATGKIKRYQLITKSVEILNLPLCYIFLLNGFPPETTMFISILLTWLLPSHISITISEYIKNIASG